MQQQWLTALIRMAQEGQLPPDMVRALSAHLPPSVNPAAAFPVMLAQDAPFPSAADLQGEPLGQGMPTPMLGLPETAGLSNRAGTEGGMPQGFTGPTPAAGPALGGPFTRYLSEARELAQPKYGDGSVELRQARETLPWWQRER